MDIYYKEFKKLKAQYYGNISCAKILDAYANYLNGTFDVEDLGVSIDQYHEIVEDLLVTIYNNG